MLTRMQIIAIWYWMRRRQRMRRKRRYCVRPAHRPNIVNSFQMFQRYYESEDPHDLENFCRLSPEQFDQLYQQIENQIGNHSSNHWRPITGKQRLVVFLR